MIFKIRPVLFVMLTMTVFLLSKGFLNKTEAALKSYIFLGVVESKNVPNENITVKDIQWATSPHFDITRVTGKPPNKAALQNLKSGQNVIVYSLGEPENFVTIAKLKSNIEQFLTDIYGEIEFAKNFSKLSQEFRNKCPFPFPSGHFISYTNTPDCESCDGSTCRAAETEVVLEKSGMEQMKRVLKPGNHHTFQINNYQIYVQFLEGQVSSSRCGQMAVGPQPSSNFVVRVTSQLSPEIRINGSKGPVLLQSGDSFKLTVNIKGNCSINSLVDHWILLYASSPNQWWSFVIRDGNYKWIKGIHYCIQMPITPLNDVKIPEPPLKKHLNMYFLAIDNNANGLPDGTWLDSAAATCNCDPSEIIIR